MPVSPELQQKFRDLVKAKKARTEHKVAIEAATTALALATEEAEAAREQIALLSGVSKKMREASYTVDGQTWDVKFVRKGLVTVELVNVQ